MSITISLVCLFVSCLIIGLESPQFMVMCLLSQTIMVAILMGLMSSIWYAYVLFLVLFGGMLILLVYASSLAPGVKLDYSLSKYLCIIVFSSVVVMISVFSKPINVLLVEDVSFPEGSMVSALVGDLSWLFYLYVVVYLLLALYNVCWMVKVFEGPLRSFV